MLSRRALVSGNEEVSTSSLPEIPGIIDVVQVTSPSREVHSNEPWFSSFLTRTQCVTADLMCAARLRNVLLLLDQAERDLASALPLTAGACLRW